MKQVGIKCFKYDEEKINLKKKVDISVIEKQKPLLQTEETEKVSKKPLSDEELSSLIKASNNKKFNEAELKVKKNENENFKKITLWYS